ncbi:unnamed protein product [Vicia faba]|uniref:RNA-directed DNA polymerase, eukaryota, Reverse transcriptase zinc-binding domain protein n=1 Tax=Vicia faba TaxID=3906 RepID=A0AAV1AWB9_VICFA|nr:unnamed protein product [Vicia faba]
MKMSLYSLEMEDEDDPIASVSECEDCNQWDRTEIKDGTHKKPTSLRASIKITRVSGSISQVKGTPNHKSNMKKRRKGGRPIGTKKETVRKIHPKGPSLSGLGGLANKKGDRALISNHKPANKKKESWEEILTFVSQQRVKRRCLVGDFNLIRNEQERKSNSLFYYQIEMRQFDEFIANMEKIDLPLIDQRFTWYQAGGGSMICIDRFLFSEDWIMS